MGNIHLMFYILRRPKLGHNTCLSFQENLKKDYNIPSIILKSNKPLPNLTTNDIILRWGCTSLLPNELKILNKAEAISKVNNKKEFRKHLQETQPQIVPKTWYNINDPTIQYPCILRHKQHAQGKYLWYCDNINALNIAYNNYKDTYGETLSYYISKYIPKIKEYRICFIQNKVVWIAQKIPANETSIAWNVAQGGKFINILWKKWPINAIDIALLAHKESKLFLSGVDIMIGPDNTPYVIEINSAPSHTSPYRKQCVTKTLFWILNNHTDNISLNENYTKYLKYIHPGLIP